MIYDKNFLLELDKVKNKIIYARITALTFDERPIETIEGKITQGSINVDGSSAVRRTCSLTMIADDFNYQNYYWSMNTKFKLEIGVQNYINSNYPDIIWFKQGIYLFTSFNTSRSTNNFTITLQGKDKMCLLNGEVGGSLESSIDFGKIEEETEKGIWSIKQIPIYEIIRNAVHVYAKEPYHNIIINDLDNYGLELLEYRYDIPMYLYRHPDYSIYNNVLLESSSITIYIQNSPGNFTSYTLKEFGSEENKHIANLYLDMLVDSLIGTVNPKHIYIRSDVKPQDREEYDEEKNPSGYLKYGSYFYTPYIFAKVEYGQTAGYKMTELTYAGDLIANVGESIMSVLDKIKNMLSEFEYFYNVDGQFVFQRKRSFINTLWTPLQSADIVYTDSDNNFIQQSEQYVESLALSSSVSYYFNEGELITAFNNNPNILNMRNDFSVWGNRKSTSGADIPIHMRYAIDKKPTYYKTFDRYEKKLYTQNNFKPDQERIFIKNNNNYLIVSSTTPFNKEETYYILIPSKEYTDIDYDWREIIYQMAKDYYAHNTEDDFELKVYTNNSFYYPTGQTGYEKYYTDIYSFWRDIYNPEASEKKNQIKQILEESKSNLDNVLNNASDGLYIIQAKIKIEEEKLISLTNELNKIDKEDSQQKNDYDAKKTEVDTQQQIVDDLKDKEAILLGYKNDYEKEILVLESEYENLEGYYTGEENLERKNWHINVYEYPYLLNFWFDFLDTEGELSKFNVSNMGSRSKAINDTAVKSIYFREIPNVIFLSKNENINSQSGYKYIQVNDIENMFSISAQGKSAKERIDELIYQHSYCIESATITTIPIYYLEPNTRIHLFDSKTNLNGDYIIDKMTIPLAYNGTMQITATKAAERIL